MNQIAIISTTQSMTSREIADLVESRHDSVKLCIDRLVSKGVISQPPTVDGGKSANGVIEKLYSVGKRDSYIIVAQLSPKFTARLVDRWQELESVVLTAPDPLAGLPAEQRALIAIMVDNAVIKAKQAEQDAVQIDQAESIKRLEARQTAAEDGHSYFTALGFCVLRGVSLSHSDMIRLGKLAAAASIRLGKPTGKVRDARYGMVNEYHESALDDAFADFHGGM
jgi:phage regulator Rha-like protein